MNNRSPGFGQEEYIKKAETALAEAFDAAVADLSMDKRNELKDHLIGALTVAMSTRPGGPEVFLEALDHATRLVDR